jgi:hypothetical protein
MDAEVGAEKHREEHQMKGCPYCFCGISCTGKCYDEVTAINLACTVDAKGVDTGKITGYDDMMKRIKQSVNYDFDTTIPYAPA